MTRELMNIRSVCNTEEVHQLDVITKRLKYKMTKFQNRIARLSEQVMESKVMERVEAAMGSRFQERSKLVCNVLFA